MKEVIYITGVSKGLGHSLAEQYLSEGYEVVGIGRTHSILHERFRFIPCDLNSPEDVKAISFEPLRPAVLINNAGLIGPLNRFLDAPIERSLEVMEVNVMAVMRLTHAFLKEAKAIRTVITISSGAASRSIPGWAAYCASKAAVDRFSETLQFEIKEKGISHRIFSVSPGVIDTSMQKEIRESVISNFSSVETFKKLKENNELQSPDDVARKLIHLARFPNDYEPILSIRDIRMMD